VKNSPAHFLRIRLKGENKNTYGVGAKVYVQTAHIKQLQEEYITRGFQSSVDPVMHIGLGKDSIIQSVKVNWLNGRVSVMHNIKADTLLVIEESKAPKNDLIETNNNNTHGNIIRHLFEDVSESSGINFVHKQSAFVDFKISPLLPYQLSKIGPCIAKADVNKDGLEDVFIGASAEQESVLYLQTEDGKFVPSASQPWNVEKKYTNADALFFDADGDGDDDPAA